MSRLAAAVAVVALAGCGTPPAGPVCADMATADEIRLQRVMEARDGKVGKARGAAGSVLYYVTRDGDGFTYTKGDGGSRTVGEVGDLPEGLRPVGEKAVECAG